MSLALLQGYSSAEEEEEDADVEPRFSDVDDKDDETPTNRHPNPFPHHFPNPSSSSSLLPSALDVFSEIAGPPEFLNNAVLEQASPAVPEWRVRHGGRKMRRDAKDLPAGAVVEAKAQLVGILDRVRSDIEGSFLPTTAIPPQKGPIAGMGGESRRVVGATYPEANDAAELLRICQQCGVPKTYSNAQGIVCPICGDRPPPDPSAEKKKGSTVKEKEKSKRMKGQSSHSTWKSETEMQLRQQFD